MQIIINTKFFHGIPIRWLTDNTSWLLIDYQRRGTFTWQRVKNNLEIVG